MELIQKQGLKQRTFKLDKDKINLTYKTTSEFKEWSVNIETIGDEILIEKKSRKGSILLGGFFLAFGIFFIAVNLADKEESLELWAWIAIALFYILIASIIFLVPLKNELHIVGGHSTLTFFLDSPNRNEVENFANKLIRKSKEILIDKYAKIDPYLPEETMMNQLIWLKNKGLISDKEYEAKKTEYKTSKLIN